MNAWERLGLEPKLSIDEKVLKRRYDEACKQSHPDSGADSEGEFEEVAHAYETLNDPAGRLRAWLNWKGLPAPQSGAVPARLEALLGPVHEAIHAVEVLAKAPVPETSLARVVRQREAMRLRGQVEGLQAEVAEIMKEVRERFADYDAGKLPSYRAQEDARALMYAGRWKIQLQAAFGMLWEILA